MIEYDKNLSNNSILPCDTQSQSDPAQVQLCHNFRKQEFPKIGIKRQLFDLYIEGICNVT